MRVIVTIVGAVLVLTMVMLMVIAMVSVGDAVIFDRLNGKHRFG